MSQGQKRPRNSSDCSICNLGFKNFRARNIYFLPHIQGGRSTALCLFLFGTSGRVLCPVPPPPLSPLHLHRCEVLVTDLGMSHDLPFHFNFRMIRSHSLIQVQHCKHVTYRSTLCKTLTFRALWEGVIFP